MRFQAHLLRENDSKVWQIRFHIECKDNGGEIDHISHSLFMGSMLSTTWGRICVADDHPYRMAEQDVPGDCKVEAERIFWAQIGKFTALAGESDYSVKAVAWPTVNIGLIVDGKIGH